MNCKIHSSQITAKLRKNKLKVTPARLELLDIFSHAKRPLSVDEIFSMFKNSKTDRVTLYRNIGALENLGLVKKISLKKRQSYYELVTDHHHHHLICKVCGKIKAVSACFVDKISKQLLKTADFSSITDHSLELFGICSSCSLKKAI